MLAQACGSLEIWGVGTGFSRCQMAHQLGCWRKFNEGMSHKAGEAYRHQQGRCSPPRLVTKGVVATGGHERSLLWEPGREAYGRSIY